ncbi:MAG: hypothetical protein R3A11_02485 [Bdellovibrionota bacterium]
MTDFRRDIPKGLVAFANELLHHGHQVFVVGGACRDLVRERVPKDWDLATSATPDQMMKLFPRSIPTGLAFGTVTVPLECGGVEVTTFRKESGSKDHRHHQEMVFKLSIEEDLKRRDFTFNAMAIDPITGHLMDPHQGRQDLKRRRLKTVGDAHLRFKEDALRMLRAARFISQVSLQEVDSSCTKAAKRCKRLIQSLPMERIREEFRKLLWGEDIKAGLLWLEETGLWAALSNTSIRDEVNAIEWWSLQGSVDVRVAALLLCMNDPAWTDNHKFPRFLFFNKKVKLRSWTLYRWSSDQHLHQLDEPAKLKQCLSHLSYDLVGDWFDLQMVRTSWKAKALQWKQWWLNAQMQHEAVWIRDLDLSGKDLIDHCLNLHPRQISIVLQGLLDLVHVNPQWNQRDILLSEAQKIADSF